MQPSPEELPVLVLSTVYPSSAQPCHGTFVRERVRALPAPLQPYVVAPVAWFPFTSELRPGLRPRPPLHERDGEIPVEHWRFLSVPAVLKCLDGVLLAASLLPRLLRLHRRRRFQVIDAHFAYPEGLAAVIVGRTLGIPVCLTLRGTLPLVAAHALRRPQAVHALHGAQRLIAVAESLRQSAASLGVPPERVRVIRNGVDLERFRPQPRTRCRHRLGLASDGPLIVSVGHLSSRKGFDLLITALSRLHATVPDARLAIVGGAGAEGYALAELRALAGRLGVADQVIFAGSRDGDDLAAWYAAADVFALASAHEGCPNVVLEALACGTPVVTTSVGDAAALVQPWKTGLVVSARTPEAITERLSEALRWPWDRQVIRRSPALRGWDEVGSEVAAELLAASRRSPVPVGVEVAA